MTFTAYDSFEEMMDDLQANMKAADARVQPWQAEIKVGDCFRESTPYGFDIYGEVLEGYEEEHLQNYRFCYCFSVACSEGERGDVHVSVVSEVITREEFEETKKKMQGAM
jgi:hypothetical protein